MSEPKPKWQRGLFWASVLAGVVSLVLVLGFFVGKRVYGSEEGYDRPGFRLWLGIYQRPLFWQVDQKGYRYADLKHGRWMTMTLMH